MLVEQSIEHVFNCIHILHLFCNTLVHAHVIYSGVYGQCFRTIAYLIMFVLSVKLVFKSIQVPSGS